MQIIKKHRIGFFVIAACLFSVSLFSAADKKFNAGEMDVLWTDGDYQELNARLRLFIEKQSSNDALRWVRQQAEKGDALCLYFDARNAEWQINNPSDGFDAKSHGCYLMKKIMQFLMRVCLDATTYVELFGESNALISKYQYFKNKANVAWLSHFELRKQLFGSVSFQDTVKEVKQWFFSLACNGQFNFLPCVWVQTIQSGWVSWGYSIGTIDAGKYQACLDDASNREKIMRFQPAAALAFFDFCSACGGWEQFFANPNDCGYVLNLWQQKDSELRAIEEKEEREKRLEQERSEREKRERFEEKARREREEERLRCAESAKREREKREKHEQEESLSRDLEKKLTVETSPKVEKEKDKKLEEEEKGSDWTPEFPPVDSSAASSSSSSSSSSSGLSSSKSFGSLSSSHGSSSPSSSSSSSSLSSSLSSLPRVDLSDDEEKEK